MLSYKKVLELILDCSKYFRLETELIHLLDIENRVLAEDIYTDTNLPPFNNSAMDGYAIRFDENVTSWKVIGEISAGHFNDFEVDLNQAVLIATGSKIPNSCDTVIPLEDIEIADNVINLINKKKFKKGANIRFVGSDITKNSLVLKKNQLLNNKHIPILAACGKRSVLVYKPIPGSIISTGDELIDIDNVPNNDKIRCSNIYSIAAQARKSQIDLKIEGIYGDNPEILKQKFQDMIESQCKIIITTGGVSVGKYDLTKDIIMELGCEILFWKTNIKPGKPILVALSKSKQIIFGLPGNPLSSFIGFEIYIKPLMKKIFLNRNIEFFSAELENNITKNDSKIHFLLGKLSYNKSKCSVSTKLSQNSGNLYDISNADCLVLFNELDNHVNKGDLVECIII